MASTTQTSKSVRFATSPLTIPEKGSLTEEHSCKRSPSLSSLHLAANKTTEKDSHKRSSISARVIPHWIEEQRSQRQAGPVYCSLVNGNANGTNDVLGSGNEQEEHMTPEARGYEDEAADEEEDRLVEARFRACDMASVTKEEWMQLYNKRTDTLLSVVAAATILPGSDLGTVENQKVLREAMRAGSGVVNEGLKITSDPKLFKKYLD